MLFASIIAFLFGGAATYVCLLLFRSKFILHGFFGLDVHKPGKPKVAEMGGIVSGIIIDAVLTGMYFYVPLTARAFVLVLLGTFTYYVLLGLVDDLWELSRRIKLGGALLGGVWMDILGILLHVRFFSANPYLPLVGQIHILFVYPFLIPVGLAVTSNAYNMYDVYNGTLTFASALVFGVLGVLILVDQVAKYSAMVSAFSLLCSGVSIGLYLMNRYPSKFFIGDVGSLPLGAAAGMVAITGNLEAVVAVAIMPMILNGFLSFGSVGKIFESHQLPERPVLVKDGMISANPHAGAPISLAGVLTSRSPLSEKQLIARYHLLTVIGVGLALATFFLTPWGG